MADSYSAKLRLRLQQTGANTNTWGALLNAAVAQLLEDSICGVATVVVTTGAVTLSQANGSQDQSRMMVVNLTGAPTATQNIIVPSIGGKLYLVVNNTGQIMTVKTSAGSGVAVPVSTNQWLAVDPTGTNVIAVNASTLGTVANSNALGGFDVTAFPRLAIFNEFTGGIGIAFSNLTDGGTITLNAMLSNNFYVMLGGNRTLVINNPSDGQETEIWIQQDGVGSRTFTWPAAVKFETGSTPTLSTAANALDRFVLKYNATLGIFIARSAIGFNTPGTTNFVITGSLLNAKIFALMGSPSGIGIYNITLAAGVGCYSLSTTAPAMDFSGFTSGSTVNFTNLGAILGRGGDGGMGAGMGQNDYDFAGTNGRPGGTALKGPGAGITFNITNAFGAIWGGGGGGGGGGVKTNGSGDCANAGGAGGGAGGGKGGEGGHNAKITLSAANGTFGGDGTFATTAAGGTAGTGASVVGGTFGAAGPGGDWGSAGTAGSVAATGSQNAPPGLGGTAGLAVDQNGGTAAFVNGGGGPNVKGAIL